MMSAYHSAVTAADFHAETRTFFAGRTVAVTGGSGFIGSHVVEQLLALGAQPVVCTRQAEPPFLQAIADQIAVRHCDLNNVKETRRAFDGASVVLNLAATVGGLEFNSKHPASIFQQNMQVFFNAIQAASQLNVDRFLVTSSACVYPRHCSIPTAEDEGVRDAPEPTNAGYGWAKRMEEFLAAKYAEEFRLSVSIARPYNAYGPRDNFDPESSHVIPSLIRKAFLAEQGEFPVWGDGSHSRSFLYVDDFARGLLEVAARYPEADPVNVGADEEASIRETAEAIGEIVSDIRGTKTQPAFDSNGLTGQARRRCDTTKMEQLLGYRAQVSLREGLRQTVEWFAANCDKHGIDTRQPLMNRT